MWKFRAIANYPAVSHDDTWALDVLDDLRIVKRYNKTSRYYDEPYLYRFSAMTADVLVFDEFMPGVEAGGASFDASIALCKCAGEAAERFCQATIPAGTFSHGTFATQAPALDPDEFRFFSPAQLSSEPFECLRWDDNSTFYWTEGFDILRARSTLLPAQLVYLPYPYRDEHRIAHPSTSGGACAKTFEDSALSGMLELLERDAFMIHYLSQSEGIRIDLKGHALFQEIEEYLSRFDLELHTYLLQTDFPVCPVMGILIDRSQSGVPAPWMSAGLKCSLDPMRAVLGAIEEACQTRPWIRRNLQELDQGIGASKEERISDIILDRALYWSNPERRNDLSFLMHSKRSIRFSDLSPVSSQASPHGLTTLLSFCRREGHPVYTADITAPAVREHGLVVTKVIMPTLQQFYLHEPHVPLASSRWREVPSRLGLREDRGGLPNPVPHFFL